MENSKIDAYYTQSQLWELSRYEGNVAQCLRARMIAAMIEPGVESILDVGCGNGFVTRHLRAKRVVGLDPSKVALAYFEGEFVVGFADKLPFADKSFDAIVCSEVIEHLNDNILADVVKEFERVCRHYLVIGVPYRENLREGMVKCLDCGAHYHVNLHCRTFWETMDIECLWPDFTIISSSFIGYSQRIKSKLFRSLRCFFASRIIKAPLAKCPKCESTRIQEQKNGICERFLDGLSWRLPKEWRPYWMVVLLKRKQTKK